MPPARRSAGSEMPNSRRIASPNRANASRMAVAISVARIAICRRAADELLGVSAANSAATSAGPMVAKYVVNAISAVSTMAARAALRADECGIVAAPAAPVHRPALPEAPLPDCGQRARFARAALLRASKGTQLP